MPVDWKALPAVQLWEAGVRRVDERRDGVHVSPTGRLIGVPYQHPDGRVARWKLFRPGVKGSRWERARQGLVLPFGLETMPSSGFAALTADALICEGESDTIAARGVVAERDGRRVCSVGIPGAGLWRAEWAHYFEAIGRVYLLGDGDPAGRAMVDRILVDLPAARYVPIPAGEDVRGMIQTGRVDELAGLLDEADMIAEFDGRLRRAAFEASRPRAHVASARRGGYRDAAMRGWS